MKKRIFVSFIGFFTFIGIFIGSITPLHAEYPDQNITWIVGYKPGGGLTRTFGEYGTISYFLPRIKATVGCTEFSLIFRSITR